jgi:hypothetical protein
VERDNLFKDWDGDDEEKMRQTTISCGVLYFMTLKHQGLLRHVERGCRYPNTSKTNPLPRRAGNQRQCGGCSQPAEFYVRRRNSSRLSLPTGWLRLRSFNIAKPSSKFYWANPGIQFEDLPRAMDCTHECLNDAQTRAAINSRQEEEAEAIVGQL